MFESKAGIGLFVVLLATASSAQTTVRVSVGPGGLQADDNSHAAGITPDGRFVLIDSWADNLVPGDTNGEEDAFVRDRRTGRTERVSLSSTGVEGNSWSYPSSITPDGRYVIFGSDSTNLVPGDFNGADDIFLRDRWNGTTELVSLGANGTHGNGGSYDACVTPDGRFVAFVSSASNLVLGDTDQVDDVFVRDRSTGTTQRVSVSSNGQQGIPSWMMLGAFDCAISADGRFVVFLSDESDLVLGDTNDVPDFFVKDRQTGRTERVSVSSSGEEQQYWFLDGFGGCDISADGRWVGFTTQAGNLVPGDTNDWFDGFLRDRQNGTTERVTVGPNGEQCKGGAFIQALSSDARFVVFATMWDFESRHLLPYWELYVRDRLLATTERLSESWYGSVGNADSGSAAISPDGRFAAFASHSDNIVPGDSNGKGDVFVRDRVGGTDFQRLCEPGVDGVASCPCSNPPGGPGQGCDNSARSGGAVLSASGATFLSSDSLVFDLTRASPGGACILLQGDALVASGAPYGRGVRCVGGSLTRLFVRRSPTGELTVPDFAAGDPSISTLSSAKGDVIQPGQRRWYLVTYRDPIVQGGCAPADAFNATPTGEVTWSP